MKHLIVVALLFCAVSIVHAQDEASKGFVPNQTYHLGDFDSINLANGNLVMHIPLLTYPQLGTLPPIEIYIRSNSGSTTIADPLCGKTSTKHNGDPPAVRISPFWSAQTYTYVSADPPNCTPSYFAVNRALDVNGGSHSLGMSPASSNTWVSSDGAVTYDVPSSVLTDRVGNKFTLVPFQGLRSTPNPLSNSILSVQDRHGNTITVNPNTAVWTDSLGRTFPNFQGVLPSYYGTCVPFSFPGQNGGSVTFSFCYSSTGFLQSVILPNQTSWTFGPASVTTPTGATISYQATTLPACGGQYATTSQAITSRSIDLHDGTPVKVWTYSYNGLVTTVTDPDLNQTVHTFTKLSGSACAIYETKTQIYAGSAASGTLLKTVDTTYYDAGVDPFSQYDDAATELGVFPRVRTTTWPNGQVSQESFVYDNAGGATFLAYPPSPNFPPSPNYPLSFGDVIQSSVSDFGGGGAGPVLRQTVTQYQWQGNSSYQAAYLLNLPCVATTYGPGPVPQTTGCTPPPVQSNQVAQTITGYDENNGSPQGVIGNVTSVTHWLNGGVSPVVQAIYNSQGMATQKVDAKGNAVTTTYDSTGLFPSQIQYPDTAGVHHIEKFAYDPNIGQITSHTDQNGQITTAQYDNMGRPIKIVYPTQVVNGAAMGSATTFSYNDTPGSLSIQRTRQQDGSNSLTDTTYFDQLGRKIQTQLNDPAGNVFTNTSYDHLGRVGSVTNPYRTTSDTTYGVTQTQYDPLGRVTTVTRPDGSTAVNTYTGRATQVQDEGNGTRRATRIAQVDGLGRLTSVCEVTGATQANGNTPSACGQDIGATGFLTTYQYDPLGNLTAVSQGGIGRSFGYDSLSRLLTAANPESGTTAYAYDANGNVLTRTRPAPNQSNPATTVTATYQYDQLNRSTSTTYSDLVTPSITRHYDTSLELGRGLNNTIGRLSAEYVTTPGGQVLSGRVFGYDPMGRVVDSSQCVPQNCPSSTAYPLNYGYDLLGHELSATNGQGVAFTYAYDAAGHMTSMASSLADANHPGTLLSGAAYNALGSLTAASVGGILSEAFAYDCRGRMVSYGSALLPGTASAPTVTNSGCPVAVAGAIRPGILGELAGNFASNRWPMDFQSSLLAGWNGLQFRPREIKPKEILSKGPGNNTFSSAANAIVLSRAIPSNKREHGSITIDIRGSGHATRTASIRYSAKDSSEKIARRLLKQFIKQGDSWLEARMKGSGPEVSLELMSRDKTAFLVSARVNGDRPAASVQVTVLPVNKGPSDLLTSRQVHMEVSQ